MTGIVLAAMAFLLALPLLFLLVGERGRLLRPSTRKVVRYAGPGVGGMLRVIHGYIYAKWPKFYIGTFVHYLFHWMTPSGKRWLANHYHGKVLSHKHATAILEVQKKIPLQDLEQVIPYATARNLMLNGPPEVAAFECPCRMARREHCEPTQVCLVIGQPFVDFLLEHHPHESRKLSQAEAIQILEEEHRRGHLHSAWFKDVCLDRFFAICNCCKCCCGGIEAMVRHGIPMMASSGFVARIDSDLCNGCGRCQEACPFEAIRVNGHAQVDVAACMGCGVCEGQCKAHAVSLYRDAGKGDPLDVSLLSRKSVE
jgi:NAD-dependent dihydropyrimidine dehydrogenase PreA subunit